MTEKARYIVTGVDVNGKRFKIESSVKAYALAINLWRGNVWEEIDGKRRRIKQVYN